jgi:hypothetical protein
LDSQKPYIRKKRRSQSVTPLPARKLWDDRLLDLRSLAKTRGWSETGIPQEYCITWLRLVACAAVWTSDMLPSEEVGQRLDRIFHELCSGCPETTINEMREQMVEDQALGNPLRRFTTAKLVEWLKVTSDEDKHLKTIISKEEAAERHRSRNRKDCDRATYLASSKKRRETAQALRATGLSYKLIAEEMKTTVDAVQKLMRP